MLRSALCLCGFAALIACAPETIAQRGVEFGGGSIAGSPAVRATVQHASRETGRDIVDGPMRYDDGISRGILTIYAQGDEKRAELT